MSEFYYLVASLPMLALDEKPLITSEEFLEAVDDALPSSSAEEIGRLSLLPGYADSEVEAIRHWDIWETSLRNAVVRLRAKGDSALIEKFLRSDGGFFMDAVAAVRNAFSKEDPLEREMSLDEARWSFCDDLEAGHDFDIVKLASYRLKLLLCEKRSSLSSEKGGENYDAVLDAVYGAGEAGE